MIDRTGKNRIVWKWAIRSVQFNFQHSKALKTKNPWTCAEPEFIKIVKDKSAEKLKRHKDYFGIKERLEG